jgi:protein ImuB
MLWVALHLPELSREVVDRGLLPDLPLAVSDGSAHRPFVLAANRAARAAGVRPGMSAAAARALAGGLVVVARDTARERAALEQLAAWAGQYTPAVVCERDAVLLEVQGSLRLFGGLARLGALLRGGVAALGYRVALGVAPVPLAAWLLARAGCERTGVRACREIAGLPARLGALPLALFDWPRQTLDALATLGIARIGEARALPRDGFRRRFGAQPLADLDRAHACAPDPRPYFEPPARYAARFDLPWEIAEAPRLLPPLERLLAGLEGWLRARGAGSERIALVLEHGRSLTTRLEIGARQPERARARWAALARERLARLTMPAAASALSIAVDAPLPYAERNASLLPDAAEHAQSWRELLERLAARFAGQPGALFGIAVHDDHRPERAWRAAPAPAGGAPARASTGAVLRPRPVWLLERPRLLVHIGGEPQYQGPLALLAGPERIEAGWWDGAPVARDYYMARNRAGETCWIYREPRDPGRWYLHGLYA